MASLTPRTEYSIAAVSKLTGVSCHALRIWERRYGFPTPERSGSNQRRYGVDQVRAIQGLSRLVTSGRSIGELIAEIQAGSLTFEPPSDAETAESPTIATSNLVEHLLAGDLDAADEAMTRLAQRHSPAEMLSKVFEPALIEVGERWFRGVASIYQEHLATGMLIRKLGRMLDDARTLNRRPAHRAIVAAVQGDRHESAVLILGTMLELSGWRVMTLGVDVPVAELRKASDALRPDAIGVSFVLSRNINKRFQELSLIQGTPVFVGGRSLTNHTGLARRHGLIPLTGSIATALPRWIAAFESGGAFAGSPFRPDSKEKPNFETTIRHPSSS